MSPPAPSTRQPDHIQLIQVDTILAMERLRPLRDAMVNDLLASIREIGLIHPITIRRPNERAVPHLVSGRNRLEAVRRLGWKSIPCCTVDSDDDNALLIEIDENLARGELSPAERAVHIAKRKEVYEKLHPETKHGAVGRGGKRDANFASFSEDASTKTDHSKRSVALDATRAKHIPRIAECIDTSLDQGDELDALAKLSPTRQADLIKRAVAGEKVTAIHIVKRERRERREVELAEATRAASARLGAKLYGVLYVDPPPHFKPWSHETGMDRAADNHYQTMLVEKIKAMRIPAAPDCRLYLWSTVPLLPRMLEVMAAWGFAYSSHIVWVKGTLDGTRVKFGTGYETFNAHELLLIGDNSDRVPSPTPGDQPISVLFAPRGEHSEKPDVFAEMIQQQFPNTPKLEMFARKPRDG